MRKDKDTDTRMLFHNAVMRQKCSLLTEDEMDDLQAWIEEDTRQRLEGVQQPWKMGKSKDVSELTAENQHVQTCVSFFIPSIIPI